MRGLRNAIENGTLAEFRRDFDRELADGPERALDS